MFNNCVSIVSFCGEMCNICANTRTKAFVVENLVYQKGVNMLLDLCQILNTKMLFSIVLLDLRDANIKPVFRCSVTASVV